MKAGSPAALLALLALVPVAGAATTPKTVSIAASPSAAFVVLGKEIGISGVIKPRVAGLAVSLQQRSSAGWLTVGAATVRANGGFSFAVHPRQPGTATYRVVTAKGEAYAGDSPAVPIQVLHWIYVADVYVQMARGTGDLNTDPVKAGGVTYQYPVALDAGCYNAWNGTAWVDYTLGRKDEAFTATVAISDDALPGTTGSYAVVADSKTLASGNLVPGQSTKLNVPLAGVSRLRLMANFPDPTGAAGCAGFYPRMVFGDAQLLGP